MEKFARIYQRQVTTSPEEDRAQVFGWAVLDNGYTACGMVDDRLQWPAEGDWLRDDEAEHGCGQT